jgi:hypothetical protein
MTYDDHLYHVDRERQCRDLADRASDPEIRRRHFELADLHARQAASYKPPLVLNPGRLAAAQ